VKSDIFLVGEWVAQVEVLGVSMQVVLPFGVRDDVIHENFAGD
jgi:hypothetical protein